MSRLCTTTHSYFRMEYIHVSINRKLSIVLLLFTFTQLRVLQLYNLILQVNLNLLTCIFLLLMMRFSLNIFCVRT